MKKIIKKFILQLVCMLALTLSQVFAQNATTAAGGTSTGTGGSATYSVGQVFYSTVFSSGNNIRQGVEQVQNCTMTADYIIYATSQAKFGENNYINGNVGVTASNGKAEFKKYDVLDPYKVWAADVNVQTPSSVNNVFMVPATGGSAPTFYAYNGNTAGLSNIDITVNNTVLGGNWKDVKVKKGITATITGNNFGKITVEEGASLTLTAAVINLEELNVNKGKKNENTTSVIFTNPASMKVKNKVTIEEDCRVNVCGPKVTFYMGDNNPDEEKFMIKGDNTWVTANIMIPNGKLQMHGGDRSCIMTGWYIIEKLDGDGKNITWNKYDCQPCAPSIMNNRPAVTDGEETVIQPPVEVKESFSVKAYPNPSATDFTIMVGGNSKEAVTVRILDINGVVRELINGQLKGNTILVGGNLIGGTYMAEVTQGKNRKLVKLVKLN
jgi:hypothetical protein